MKLSLVKIGTTGLIASILPSSLAGAQDSYFDRDRYVSVTERAQPAYDAEPLRAGSFELFPELEAGVGTQTNLFATENDEVDDIVIIGAPSLRGRSTWSRHELNFDANVRHREFVDVGSQSTTAYGGSIGGRLDVSSSVDLTARARAGRTYEPRTAAAADPNSREPVEVDRVGGEFGATYQTGRLELSANAGFDEYDYGNAVLNDGTPFSQDFRDRDESKLHAKAAWAVNRDVAVFVEGAQIERDYGAATAAGRDSTGEIVRVGANFELPVLIRGNVSIGHQSFEFDDPSFDIDGVSIDAEVQWFATQLVTLTAGASQSVEDPGLLATAGADVSSWMLRGDYEARRNLLLFAQANADKYDFEGIDREDDRVTAAIGATYKVNKNVWVETSYRHINQDSDVQEFSDNRLMLALKLRP